MERKLESKYTALEFSTILSIIENILIGLESILNYDYLDDKVIASTHKYIEIIKRYYYELSQKNYKGTKEVLLSNEEMEKINFIFEVEHQYKTLVVEIWQRELTDVSLFDNDQNYTFLVHMFRNSDTIEYQMGILGNNNIGCISTSVISSSDNHRHFQNEETNYGLIYGINESNFLGACEADAQLEHTTDDSLHINSHSFFTVKKREKHSINSIVYTSTKNYQMTLTKTPACIMKPYYIPGSKNIPFYSEIGLDKEFSKPSAVIHYYGIREIDEQIEDKIKYFANLYNIPIIRIPVQAKLRV
jgi:hypothetical protein